MAIATLATLQEIQTYLGLDPDALTPQRALVADVVRKGVQKTLDNFMGMALTQRTLTEFYPVGTNLRVRSELIDAYERSGNKVIPVERYVNERRILRLQNTPVRSITSVYENPDAWLIPGGDWPAENLLDPSDYMLDCLQAGMSWTGFLVRNIAPWSVAERCVKITYVAGLSADELEDYPDILLAYYTQVQLDYNQAIMHLQGTGQGQGVGAIVQEHIDSWGVQYDQATNAQLYGMQNRIAPRVARILEPYVNYSRFI